jgi:cytochrome c-type biogenesis protein CcmH
MKINRIDRAVPVAGISMNSRWGVSLRSWASKLFVSMILASLPVLVWSGEAAPTEQDPVRQERAVRLSEQLRCLVCQNQSIADSNAELAVDLRRQIHEQIALGRSDGEIVDFMVQRYGDFVLYRPPVKATTILLWFGPALLLLIGIVVLARHMRARRATTEKQTLSDEERRRAEALLTGGKEEHGA